MQTKSDAQLLGEYAAQHSDPAFAEIVARHTDLVYSVACRQTGSPELAREVAQMVFTDLARKAHSLPRDVLLTGWLYEAARFAGANAIRGERRRQVREQEALAMHDPAPESTPGWEQLCPVLDDAMGDLCAADRNAILLRYFKNQDFQTVGLALGVSDAAAQKRASRAVEHLREFLAKRGVVAGASGLVLVVSAHSVQAAPVGMAVSLAAAAMKGAAVATANLTLIKSTLKSMASKKLKTVAIAVVLILMATITTTVVVKTVRVFPPSSPPDIQGAWEGVREFPNVVGVLSGEQSRSRIVFRFIKTNGTYQATGELIDTSRERFQAASFGYDYPSVRFDMGQNKSYQGMLNAEATEISGVIYDGNSSILMLLKRTAAPNARQKPLAESDYVRRPGSDLQGRWEGTLGNGASAAPLIVKIAEPSTGIFHAELDNMAGPWMGQPLTVNYEQRQVQLQVASGAGLFEGTMNNEASEMVGQWVQGGVEFRMTLRRANQ